MERDAGSHLQMDRDMRDVALVIDPTQYEPQADAEHREHAISPDGWELFDATQHP
jgi:hypothetical protein